MANGKGLALKVRIHSIEETSKITKAMGLVASSKILKAKERVDKSRPYCSALHQALSEIVASGKSFMSPYLSEREKNKKCIVIFGGDRGLAGGYNHNIFKLADQHTSEGETLIVPIGKKSLEYYDKKDFPILTKDYSSAADITVSDCFALSKILCTHFLQGQLDEVKICYTNFQSMLEQVPTTIQVLPLKAMDDNLDKDKVRTMLYEPSEEEVFDAIVPEYVAGILYSALCEAQASEHAARHTAMESSSKNAEEMKEALVLQYNRARQGAITQEITEIISGSGD